MRKSFVNKDRKSLVTKDRHCVKYVFSFGTMYIDNDLDSQIILDGEQLLCRARGVIRDLWRDILKDGGSFGPESFIVKRVTDELDLLDSYVEREARLEDV